MESVVIVTNSDADLEGFRSNIPADFQLREAAEGIVIERSNRRAYLNIDAQVMAELEPEDASEIRRFIPNPHFYVLDFSDISVCRDVLMAIADRGDVLVDNNHGVILPGSEFVRLLRSRLDWDWRLDAPGR